MLEDRALAADEREEIESNLQHAYLLAGLDEEAPLPPSVVVRTINELVRELMAQHPEQEDAVEFSVALGCLLGEQWRSEFGWEWRVVSFGEDEGYGMVPADRRIRLFSVAGHLPSARPRGRRAEPDAVVQHGGRRLAAPGI
jgi:hypothetical protein